MNIQLIQGNFNAKDALEIITQMIHVKVKYHENKISKNKNEEDIKFREDKIKRLLKDLYDCKKYMEEKGKKISVVATVEIK